MSACKCVLCCGFSPCLISHKTLGSTVCMSRTLFERYKIKGFVYRCTFPKPICCVRMKDWRESKANVAINRPDHLT